MPDIIKRLPDSVANQIAAGEVIQRPSSVVKELVENAIDAGATRVEIVVEDAGRTLIQVIDNGKGMSETDARLAFERHATSKISQASDLFSLMTMGFRGEALPSIAAVAQVELRTRTVDEEIGVSIVIEGSRFKGRELISCPVGANFSVRNLFFNVPARRKFLKSNHTEMNNVLQELERISLAHTDVAFTLTSGNTLLLKLSPGNFRTRLRDVFGSRVESGLLPVEVETPLANISGFVSNPDRAKRKGAHQFFFVNGRYMRHPYFAKAVQSAYERLVGEGEQVPFFLQLQVDPAKIDVNIHPQKTEIKFEDEQAIFQILLAAVREAVGRFQAVPVLDFDMENCPDIPVFDNTLAQTGAPAQPRIHLDPTYNPFTHLTGQSKKEDVGIPEAAWPPNTVSSPQAVQPTDTGSPFIGNGSPELYSSLEAEQQAEWTATEVPMLQFEGTYIVAPAERGLFLINISAAHARVLFERTLRQMSAGRPAATASVLFPETLQLPPSSAVVMEQMMPALLEAGFDLSPLGDGCWSIMGIPSGLEGLSPTQLLSDLVTSRTQLPPPGGEGEEADIASKQLEGELRTHIAATLSLHGAIPQGQLLSQEEMQHLVRDLFATREPAFSPSGARTYVLLTPIQVEKLFSYSSL